MVGRGHGGGDVHSRSECVDVDVKRGVSGDIKDVVETLDVDLLFR